MKNSHSLYYGLPLVLLFFCCNNRMADSEKQAKEENDAMIDSQRLDQAPPASTAVIPTKADADFLVEAASGGMMEVQLGQLVQNTSKNEQVKAFAAMMIQEHGTGGDKLKQLAASKNITLPEGTSSNLHKSSERLQKTSKEEFDRAYMELMVDDHKKDIREFEKAAKDATDSEIKALAAATLPTLYKHLDSAQQILKRMPPKDMPVKSPPYQ